jgi:uncharacterized membrane protein (UPF0127 family)
VYEIGDQIFVMRKLFIFLLFIIIAVLIILTLPKIIKGKTNFVIINLNNKQYKLLVADNEFLWQKGLSGIKKLKYYDGMLFVFPDKQIRTFWNQNTYLDIKIYWLDDNKVIGTTDLPAIGKTVEALKVFFPQPVNKVIELVQK